MPPKRSRQQNKTVTIYNSKASASGGGKKEKGAGGCYEQNRNSTENWEFHFKPTELDEVRAALKCKDLSGVPLLIGGAVLSRKDLVANLLRHGYNINEADKNNMTPICWAVKLKQMEMVKVLLNNKADPTAKPNHGEDAIFMAMGNSAWDEDSFILMWNHMRNVGHTDVNSANKNGHSMLHLAVRRDWNVLFDVLLNSEANINAATPSGVTPLMIASYRNNYNLVTKLLAKGASVKKRNCDGFTALCYAFSSVIIKNLAPPYVIIEKLKNELAKNKVYLADYLKDRLKIISNPVRRMTTDPPNAEQMLQHITTFIMCNMDDGFDVLWNQLNIVHIIKESLERNCKDKDKLKLPLLMLNTLIKNLPFCVGCFESDEAIANTLVTSGCFDACLNILVRHDNDQTLTFLALSPIITCKICKPKWIEINAECLKKFHAKFVEILNSTEMSLNDFKMMQEKAEIFHQRLSKVLIEIESSVVSIPDGKSNAKKSKRRTKALKAKIAKIKTAELTERFNHHGTRRKPANNNNNSSKEEYQDGVFEDATCVSAIKSLVSVLDDDHHPKFGGFRKDDWKNAIVGLPFNNGSNVNFVKGDEYEVDLAIKYLENVLDIIVNKYKMIWELDHSYEDDFIIPEIDSKVELQQSMEKENLVMVHKEFYNLTRNIRQLHDNDAESSVTLLKELEKLLLTHAIRGETILEQVAGMETVKVNVTMPNDFENKFPKYVQQVINDEIQEIDDVVITFIEHISPSKNFDNNGMGDYVYMNELNKKCDCNKSDYYALNICEDNDEKICCNKGCVSLPETKSESKDSRWCSLLRSLEMMEDSQLFLNGRIRISNVEKRESHVLSPSGNFAAIEIGLGRDATPLAVKFVPKNDPYAPLLKSQIDPILELRHRNVLHYHTCAYDCSHLVIATPLCEYNLGQYVLKMKHTQMLICKIGMIKQMLSGLMYLHDHDEPIVHGNLKPSNILIDQHGVFRLAEFGIHKVILKAKYVPDSTVIWYATESYRLFKQTGVLSCTCASDIQVAAMLVHFAITFGAHPFGKEVVDILKNLEKAAPQMQIKDMELMDLLMWMLLGEPGERPTIHQVLSHIFFWSDKKKWRYILACACTGSKSTIPLDTELLHSSLDKTALKENISGNCWVRTAKKQYPEATFIDHEDTPSGMLKFIKFVVENNLIVQDDGSEKSLCNFILNEFPMFGLSLYRMIENTEWSDHRVFMPFHNVVDY